jgi:uncharacterized membrane protein
MESSQISSALAIAAATSAGVADFLAARVARRLPATLVAAWTQTLGLILIAVAFVLAGGGEPSRTDVLMSILAGISIAIGIGALYRCLAIGPIGVTAPVAAVGGAAVPVLGAAALGEVLAVVQYFGLLLGLVSVALMAHTPDHAPRSTRSVTGIAIALLAGVGIGVFGIFLDATTHDAGQWPIAIARAVAAAGLWIAIVKTRASRNVARPDWSLLLPCGLLDGAAMVAFLLALRSGELSIVAVLTAFYPAATIALSSVFDREKLLPTQWAGLFTAAAAIALII